MCMQVQINTAITTGVANSVNFVKII